MKLFATIALAFVTVFSASPVFAEPELRGSPTELTQYLKDIPKTVSVVGTAEVKVQADRAVVSLSVRTEDKLLATALRANQKLRAEILSSLNQKGLKSDQIKASQFSQTPKYGLFGDKAKSYVVENTVKVTVHNEKEFQAVAGVVDSVNEARYLGVEFEQTDKVTYKNKALAEACDKASEKKQLLESKFGFKLVAQKMSEGVKVTPVGTQLAQYAEYGSSSRSSKAVGVTSISGSTSDGGDEGGANFGELIYTGEVTVEYRVEYRVEK
ncbi:MAG: SIMPL domain-containing protein [Limisphaerales bacterium]